MPNEQAGLTAAEWNVMDCLWKESPLTVMQMVALLRQRTGWAKSTSTTMISRMEKKGLIFCNPGEKPRRYYPGVAREQAVRQESQSFLNRVFQGSVSLMMNTVVRQQNLTQEEIDELLALLQNLGGNQT